jgi:hypothetical protein
VESAQDTDLDLATAGYVLHNKRSSPGGGLVDQMELLNMTSADGTTYGSVWSGRTPPPGYTSDIVGGGGGGGGGPQIIDSCNITSNTNTSNTLGSVVSCRYNPSVDSAPTPHQTPQTQTKLVPCRACIVRGGGDHMYESPRAGELDGGGSGCS